MSFLLKQAVNTLEADIGSVNDQVSTLTVGAPIALQTLTQLAKALNDDASFASTVANTLATKADAADVTASLGLKANTVETQPLLTSDPQSTGVSVLSNNAIRTIFGVPLEWICILTHSTPAITNTTTYNCLWIVATQLPWMLKRMLLKSQRR